MLQPTSGPDLAEALAQSAASRQPIHLQGNGSKAHMGGPIPDDPALQISTRRLNQVLQYEPKDLTISVQAGMPWAELTRLLAAHGQMIPLDPPNPENATVGGVLAANQSGPRRRLYGTARDLVIGMQFATLEGKLVETGGMVVKNVAGLDMAKLMIGSFGTLAAIVSANFRLHPIPAETRAFTREFPTLPAALEARDRILKSVLQPAGIELIRASSHLHLHVIAGGSPRVMDRYQQELPGFAPGPTPWQPEYPAAFGGAILRASCRLTDLGTVIESMPGPVIARAANGVLYAHFENAEEALGKGIIEWANHDFRRAHAARLWPNPGDDFPLMEKIKKMFDPESLLNRGRLYGRI